MDLFLIVSSTLLFGLMPRCLLAEETFQNTTNLCEICDCRTDSKFILDCQRRNFEHTIANWPDHSTKLIATFSYNNISNLEILPDSDLVEEVILSHCQIRSLDNGAFKTVKNMIYLDLSYNYLTTEEIASEKFKGPYNNDVYEPLSIEALDLSYNQIHSLPHNLFEHLQSLNELNLQGNRLKVLDPPSQAALSSLKNLQLLNLANNDLTELVGDAVRSLQKLRILNLSSNELDFVPHTLNLLSDSLEAVYLDNNLIFEITNESFLGVKGISTLSLTNLGRLRNVNANSFAPLTRLSILYLSDNPSLTFIDRDAFGVNQTLRELYIHNNSLQDLHYNLTKWSSLRIFSLAGNDFYCDCDLYEISRDLDWEIKRNENGPYCINPVTGASLMIYNLTEDACEFQQYAFRASHIIEHHFQIVKLVFLVVSAVFVVTSLIVVAIVILRFRKYRMNQRYPFATQVVYNPLRN